MSPPDGSGALWAGADAVLAPREARARRNGLARALERLEDLRETMMAKLDAIDGDPDFEPYLSTQEPDGAYVADSPWNGDARSTYRRVEHGPGDDREEDDDFEQSISGSQACGWGHGIDLEASEEDAGEPSLGWTEKMDQRSLGSGSEELEPSLGSVEGWYGDQTRWGQDGGVRDDREWECEDEGAQVDAEPDRDGEGTSNPLWQIAGRDMHKIDGADHELDLDELPDTLEASFARAGVVG